MASRGRWLTRVDGEAIHLPGVPSGAQLPDLPGAICAQVDPAPWFPEVGESPESAKAICRRCPERLQCLQWALDHNEAFGIWGGLTAKERAELRRRSSGAQGAA